MSALPNYLTRTALRYFEGLGTPLAVAASAMMRYGDWDGLAELKASPRCYTDPKTYARDAASVAFLSKLVDLPVTWDRSKRAVDTWWAGERQCFHTNERLTKFLPEFDQTHPGATDSGEQGRVSAFMADVRKEILSWIGPCPPQLLEGRHGPGATYSDRGRLSTIPDKMASIPTLTRGALWFLPQWLGTQWGSAVAENHGELSFVPGNRFATVPKNAKTDRSIAAEPSINAFYQLGIGRSLRARLRSRVGWDLDTAQDIHRAIAQRSSVTREFATLDLSNASDTVSKNLVRILLPHKWHDQLVMLRSPKTYIGGKWVVLEKFSSMGNGFTFELETIIFAALSCIAVRQCGGLGLLGVDVFVFGDDIIVPNGHVDAVTRVLEFCGFSLNGDKSFSGDIPFRESCGGDYFMGKPVRPYYLKALPDGPQGFIALANGLSAVAQRLASTGHFLGSSAWHSVLDCLPSHIRTCRGPKDLGDIVIHDERVDRWSVSIRNSIRYIRCLKPGSHRKVAFSGFQANVVLASATYGVQNVPHKMGATQRFEGFYPRDAVTGYRVGWTPFS